MSKRSLRNRRLRGRENGSNNVEINVAFANDAEEGFKSPEIDENLSSPGTQETAESPRGSQKTNFTKQVADAVFGSKMRATAISIFNKAAQYSGDYLTINTINNVGMTYSIGSSLSRAVFKGSMLDFMNVVVNHGIQMADMQMQKEKENIKSEVIRNKTGLTSYMKSRMAGKKI